MARLSSRARADLRVLRERASDAAGAIDRIPSRPIDGATQLCKIVNLGAMPSTVPAYFAANPATLAGAEAEGGSASVTADTSSVLYPLMVGSVAPVAGDLVVAHAIGGRWVGQKSGQSQAPGGNLCLCTPFSPPTVPATLTCTDSVMGPVTLTFGTTIHGPVGWSAQRTVSVTGLATRYCAGNPVGTCWGAPAPPSPTTITTYFFYSLYCNPNSPYNLIMSVDSYYWGYDTCNPVGGNYGAPYFTDVAISNPGCSGVNNQRGFIAVTSSYVVNKAVCSKLNVTFTMAAASGTPAANPYASGANFNVAA